MKEKTKSPRWWAVVKELLAYSVVVLLVLGLVVGPLAKGVLYYRNYFDELVFLPYVLGVIVLIFVVAFIKPKRK